MGKAALLDRGLHQRLVDSLYVEAMVMADEARSYFDSAALPSDLTGDPLQRVAFACESLKVTTRLMHVIAWLLSQRAWQRGEIGDAEMGEEKYRLGVAAQSDTALAASFPFAARSLVEASQELYERVARLQQRIELMRRPDGGGAPSPARALMDRLSSAF
ncbi:regulator of CtrA degradation [Sphingobium faniae]|nr:regulator of CtrA degradation [Sphingobium faniae]